MSGLFTTGVRPAIDAFLLAEAAKKRDYGSYWSASSAGYCMRKNIYDRLGLPHTSEDPRKQRVFTSGHIFHDWIQEITRNAGLSVAQEVELQDEDLMIRGHFDDLVLIKGGPIYSDTYGGTGEYTFHHGFDEDDPDNQRPDKLILYDYKTVNSRSFTYAKANGLALSHYHKMQLGTYLFMLRKLHGEPVKPAELNDLPLINEARILKISKDDLRMSEQQLLYTPELAKEVSGYWTTLNGYWKKKLVPKCTCADYENGFMAKDKFNPFYYDGEPCSTKWLAKHKELAEGWKVQP